jgi:tRNA(Ile2) C34 agmatinyltransferase TiaS
MAVLMKADSLWYPVCQKPDCNEKVQADNNAGWQCKKCDQSYAMPKFR